MVNYDEFILEKELDYWWFICFNCAETAMKAKDIALSLYEFEKL